VFSPFRSLSTIFKHFGGQLLTLEQIFEKVVFILNDNSEIKCEYNMTTKLTKYGLVNKKNEANVTLLSALFDIEQYFKVDVLEQDMDKFECVGDICRYVQRYSNRNMID